jgi:hypothetical protein
MQETERLMSLIAKFRIGGGADPIRSELEKVAPHVFSTRPAEQKMAHGGSPTKRKTAVGSGGKHTPSPDGDGWEEF